MTKLGLTAIALLLASTSPAAAQITEGWTGEASLTGSKTTGNTETTDIGLGLKLNKEGDVWRHKFKALADRGKAAGINNKKRYALGYQLDRDINERLYAFGTADLFSDDFGPFQEGYYVGAGLGYKAILPDPIGWNLEAGLGFRSQESQASLGIPPVSEEELAGRLFSDFDYQFNDSVSLYNDTELTYASSDTYIWNEIGITAQLLGNLAARASYRVDHHTDVPVGIEKTDTISRVGIVYTMK